MDTLPKGITGFWNYYKTSFFARLFKIKQKPILEVDTHLIKNAIAHLETTFKTVVYTPPQADTNFHTISLFSKTDSYKVLVNNTYPFYCGIKSTQDGTTFEFCDVPQEITHFLNESFTELSKTYLEQEITSQHLRLLDPIEIQQITYWETKKIGNIIFNTYD